MKLLVVFISTFLVCKAAPAPQIISFHPTVYSTWPVVSAVPAVTQYHAQDALGQYSYGYSGGPSAKTEVKTLDGVTRGSYSYIDSNAQVQTVNYVADALGFRVAATNLPVAPVDNNAAPVDNAEAPKPVEDTDEVKLARAEHLEAVSRAQTENSEPEAETIEQEAPEPVKDTPEVQKAREEHLQAVEEAKSRSAVEPEVVEQPKLISSPIVVPASVHYAASPVAVLRADPGAAFAYSVVAPGHPQILG